MFSTSIIIVNYNAEDHLSDCIKTLNSTDDIIVVDNASSDNSLSLIQMHQRRNFRIIRNATNLGFAIACNIGAAASDSEYLLFLNPDCRLEENTISELLKVLNSAPDTGIVGGLILNPNGTEQAGGRRSVPTPWRSFVRAFGLSKILPKYFKDFNLHLQPLPSQTVEVEAVSGACMLMRKKTFEQLGGWDNKYFLHCEDLDLCMRYRGAGYRILFVPSARVVHYKGVCSKGQPLKVEWHKHKGMLRFYHKFFRHQYPGILMWVVNISVVLRFSLIACYYGFKNLKDFLYDYSFNKWRNRHGRVSLNTETSLLQDHSIESPTTSVEIVSTAKSSVVNH